LFLLLNIILFSNLWFEQMMKGILCSLIL
jgi:hypothetical protein